MGSPKVAWVRPGLKGTTLALLVDDTPDGSGYGVAIDQYNGPVTLTRNGVSRALGRPIMAGADGGFGAYQIPYLLWAIPDTPIGPADTCTVSAPPGFAAAAGASLPALADPDDPARPFPVTNTAGTPLVPPPDLSARQIMPVGLDVERPNPYSPQSALSNMACRIGPMPLAGSNVNADNYPISGSVTVQVQFGTNANRFPGASEGIWHIAWNGAGSAVPTLTKATWTDLGPVTIAGYEHARAYQVTKAADQVAPDLQVKLTAPISNLGIYDPKIDVTQPIPLWHPSLVEQLKDARVLRFLNPLMCPGIGLASDFPTSTRLGLTPGKQYGLPITKVANYTDTAGYFGAKAGAALVELTTAAPHGFVTSQKVGVSSLSKNYPSLSWTSADGSISGSSSAEHLGGLTLVTSPTTYVQRFFPGNNAGPRLSPDSQDIAGDLTASTTAVNLFRPGDLGALCSAVAARRGDGTPTHLYVTVPYPLATGTEADTELRAYAQAIIGGLDADTHLYVEFANETWNDQFIQYDAIDAYARTHGGLTHAEAVVVLSGRVFDAFRAAMVAAGRPASAVKCVLNSQFSNPGYTTQLMNACDRFDVSIDHVVIAPYVDVWDIDDDVWDPVMVLDAYQMIYRYRHFGSGKSAAPLRGMMVKHQQLVAASAVNPTATIAAYEGGFEGGPHPDDPQRIPADVGREITGGTLSRYALRHPAARGATLGLINECQVGGMDFFCYFEGCAEPISRTGSNAFDVPWGIYWGQDEVAGLGDGSDGLADNRLYLKYLAGPPVAIPYFKGGGGHIAGVQQPNPKLGGLTAPAWTLTRAGAPGYAVATSYRESGFYDTTLPPPITVTFAIPAGAPAGPDVTITPAAHGVACTFAPPSVTLPRNGTAQAATLTCQPQGPGFLVLTSANDRGLVDPTGPPWYDLLDNGRYVSAIAGAIRDWNAATLVAAPSGAAPLELVAVPAGGRRRDRTPVALIARIRGDFAPSGTVTAHVSDDAGGAFSATSLALTAAAPAAPLTYTPPADAAISRAAVRLAIADGSGSGAYPPGVAYLFYRLPIPPARTRAGRRGGRRRRRP